MPGIWISIKMRSGFSRRARSTASVPTICASDGMLLRVSAARDAVLDRDAMFEHGLTLILDGMRVQLG